MSSRVVLLVLSFAVAFSATPAARQATSPPVAAAPAAAPQGRGGGPVVSPEVAADGRVTFRLRAPNASDVAVALPGGRRLPMQKDAQGVWSATSDVLEPDVYMYSLSVDGASINDPSNRQRQTSFANFQSMFMVPGPKPWLPAAGVARGAVARHAFHSAIANDDRDFFVYTPPGYDARRAQPYPVLYLLHGLGDDAERWLTGGGGAHNILDNLIAKGQALPMVVVSPLGYGTSRGPAGGREAENVLGYEKILLNEVVPVVEKAYHVSRNREQRAIAGLSMGGAESLYVGLRNLDRFAWIAAFSSALAVWPAVAVSAPPPTPGQGRGGNSPVMTDDTIAKTFPALSSKDNGRIRMLWIVCGTTDGLIGVNRQFKDWLRAQNIRFTEQEVPDMAHVWPLWRQNVADMVPKLFR